MTCRPSLVWTKAVPSTPRKPGAYEHEFHEISGRNPVRRPRLDCLFAGNGTGWARSTNINGAVHHKATEQWLHGKLLPYLGRPMSLCLRAGRGTAHATGAPIQSPADRRRSQHEHHVLVHLGS